MHYIVRVGVIWDCLVRAGLGGGVTLACSDRKTKSEHGVENGEGKERRERGKEVDAWGEGCFTRDEEKGEGGAMVAITNMSCFCWLRMKDDSIK